MDGFPTQDQYLPTREQCRQRVRLLLAGLTVAFSLCISSGCATMQGAKKDLHLATCGETDSHCPCSCGEYTAANHAENETAVPGEHVASAQATGQHHLTGPPMYQNHPATVAVQPRMLTIQGTPGVWMPKPSITPNSGFVDSPATAFDNGNHPAGNSRQPMHEQQLPADHASQGKSSVPLGQTNSQQGAVCTPDSTRTEAELKEYRMQFQILSQQISQMKQAQDSIKASQETLQQSHDREILELKLQQTVADRDRLERERELDRELQKQRERDLETIDSFSQIIENVAQIPVPQGAAPGGHLRPVPQTSTQSVPGPSKPSQLLPTVDESR